MATLKNGDKSVDFADNKCKIVNLKLAEKDGNYLLR